MRGNRAGLAFGIAAAVLAAGAVACAIGFALDRAGFFRAWLCAYLFWIGVPLAGITLVLVHDLSGGAWMASARPTIGAAIATMPLASVAGIPAFAGLNSIYSWSHLSFHLSNAFYLNRTDFFVRYAIYVALWNLLAAFALWGPRPQGRPIAPSLSWLSGIGLVALALSAGFASIDWILSLEPRFWSAAFPYAAAASWFNTGLALILLAFAISSAGEQIAQLADLARILLATTIFWAYIEFVQFLIIWEENLKTEIPWYLKRVVPAWRPALDVSIGLGFVIPFFVLLWTPTKRNRIVVAAICALILVSRVADKWWLVLPEFPATGSFWLTFSATVALGGAIVMIFIAAWRYPRLLASPRAPTWTADHG